MPAATSTAKVVLTTKAALAPLDERSALRSRRSFGRTRSRAKQSLLAADPRANQVDERLLQGLAAPHLIGSAGGHDFALVDDGHVIADLFDPSLSNSLETQE